MATLYFVVNKSASSGSFSSLFTLSLAFVVTYFTLHITVNIPVAVVSSIRTYDIRYLFMFKWYKIVLISSFFFSLSPILAAW